VLKIGKGLPSKAAVEENAKQLARYGSICQQNGLVPIIEPEILQDGNHSIDVCAQVSERVFSTVMRELFSQHLLIEGLLLKPNMVTPGIDCKERATSRQIAEYTVRTLSRTMVPSLPGVVFLSGGQSEEDATLNPHAMNKMKHIPKPWALTFSYGRALQ
jgi:fructose-bisphosphate aldolase class I